MQAEIAVAVHFVSSYLYNKLPRRRVDAFGVELHAALTRRCAKEREGLRVRVSGPEVDGLVLEAARLSGLDVDELLAYLPSGLCVVVRPRQVAYQLGVGGSPRLLYSAAGQTSVLGPGTTDCTAPVLYTAAAFAQTKFGSTKLKLTSRASRVAQVSAAPGANRLTNVHVAQRQAQQSKLTGAFHWPIRLDFLDDTGNLQLAQNHSAMVHGKNNFGIGVNW